MVRRIHKTNGRRCRLQASTNGVCSVLFRQERTSAAAVGLGDDPEALSGSLRITREHSVSPAVFPGLLSRSQGTMRVRNSGGLTVSVAQYASVLKRTKRMSDFANSAATRASSAPAKNRMTPSTALGKILNSSDMDSLKKRARTITIEPRITSAPPVHCH